MENKDQSDITLADAIRQAKAKKAAPTITAQPPVDEAIPSPQPSREAEGEGTNDAPAPAPDAGVINIDVQPPQEADGSTTENTSPPADGSDGGLQAPEAPAATQEAPAPTPPTEEATPQQGQPPAPAAAPTLLQRLQEDETLRTMVGAYLAEGDVSAAELVRMRDEVPDMDDDAVLRKAISLETGETNEQVLDTLVEVMLRREGITEELDEQVAASLKRVVANQYREKLIKRADALKERIEAALAEAIQPPPQEQAVPAEVEELIRQVQAHVVNDPVAVAIKRDKAIRMNIGGVDLTLPVADPDEVVNAPLQGFIPLLQHAVDAKGMPDMRKLALAHALLRDPDAFIRHLVGVGRTLTMRELGSGLQGNQLAKEGDAVTPPNEDAASLAEQIRRARAQAARKFY